MKNTRVAVDVGGTFTDVVIMDETTGAIRIEKTSSTPDDPMVAILNGIDQGGIDLSEVSMFSHGTTVATNALITRNLARSAMICTEGFRDVVEIRRANKEDLWDTYKESFNRKDPEIIDAIIICFEKSPFSLELKLYVLSSFLNHFEYE